MTTPDMDQTEMERAFQKWQFTPQIVPSEMGEYGHVAFQEGFKAGWSAQSESKERLEEEMERFKKHLSNEVYELELLVGFVSEPNDEVEERFERITNSLKSSTKE